MPAAPRYKNPQVRAAAQQARQTARSQGSSPQQVRQASRQAAQQTRQTIRNPMPQPPPDQGQAGTPGYYQYTPTAESQLNQPYQDLSGAGAYGMLGDVLGQWQGEGQMADIYGQGAAGTLGQYGQLLGGNMPIQQNLQNEITGIQQGNLEVDPATEQMLGQQQRDLQSQLQRQLGPDWATSSAGIEAMGRFQQGANTLRGTQNYNRLLGLINAQQGGMQNLTQQGVGLGAMYGNQTGQMYDQAMGMRANQLGGSGQMLNQLGQLQGLYGNIPQTMGQFGQAMSGQSGAAVGAQGPYQQDRTVAAGLMAYPTPGQYMGQMLGQSGDRWAKIGAATMNGG